MARSLSVKIPTATLIADVEATIANIEAEIATYPADVEAYRKATKAHQEIVLNAVIEAIKNPDNIGGEYDFGAVIRVSPSNRYGNGGVNIAVNTDLLDLPKAPEKPTNPNDRQHYGREYTTKLDLLKKNLKVLKMTNQEEVNASTYNTVMELL
jgi:hypothetical protein